jgi:peptidoglycan L-alanyl-D-glutamate endopeptidase CwlK
MGFKLGNRSLSHLGTCHTDLQKLAKEVISRNQFDFGITCGYRSQDTQDQLVHEGKSKVEWPNSKHNKRPSQAFDFVLYVNGKATYNEKDKPSYYMAVGYFRAVADELNIKIRCGADWDSDWDVKDQSFHDLPHIELL